jgi:hypothetical protein
MSLKENLGFEAKNQNMAPFKKIKTFVENQTNKIIKIL